MRRMNSAFVRASRNCTDASAKPPSRKCTCASMNPGVTIMPFASMIRDTGRAPEHFGDLSARANLEDLFSGDRDTGSPRLPRISGPDVSVDDRQSYVAAARSHSGGAASDKSESDPGRGGTPELQLAPR